MEGSRAWSSLVSGGRRLGFAVHKAFVPSRISSRLITRCAATSIEFGCLYTHRHSSRMDMVRICLVLDWFFFGSWRGHAHGLAMAVAGWALACISILCPP